MLRTDKLKKAMRSENADAALIVTTQNVTYYSGFRGDSSQLLITQDKEYLFTDFRYTEQAEAETDFVVVETKGSTRNDVIFETAKKEGVNKLGIDLSGVSYHTFQSYLPYIDEADIVDLSDTVLSQRWIKDEEEMAAMRKGAEHNDKLFDHICKMIKPGVSELDIRAELIYFMNQHGADVAFAPIVASGENGSLPHATPSNRKFQAGDFVTMDYGCKFDGYCSDFTRTVAISDIDKEQQKVYDIVRCAGDKALMALKSGMTGKEIDAVAREYIAAEGYVDAFGHGLGHGVGMFIHEAPGLNSENDTVLETGMAVTIEPGIYLKGKYGVRIEDLCIVTDGGCINLNAAPRELIIV